MVPRSFPSGRLSDPSQRNAQTPPPGPLRRGRPRGEFTAGCLFQQAARILAKLHVPQPNGGFTVKFLSYLVGSFAALTALTTFASFAQAKEVSYVLQTPGVV